MKTAPMTTGRAAPARGDAGPAFMALMVTAAGMDLLLAEMQALAAILPGFAAPETADVVPGEPGFDDLPV